MTSAASSSAILNQCWPESFYWQIFNFMKTATSLFCHKWNKATCNLFSIVDLVHFFLFIQETTIWEWVTVMNDLAKEVPEHVLWCGISTYLLSWNQGWTRARFISSPGHLSFIASKFVGSVLKHCLIYYSMNIYFFYITFSLSYFHAFLK